MKQLLSEELLDDLYAWLSDRAAGARACPGNAEIARRYEFGSVATAAKAVGRLEKQGRITVLRGWTARQATIVATGDSTAPIRQADRAKRALPAAGALRVAVPSGPRIVGPVGRQCQWIDGEPRGDDTCKCLRETEPGESWCRAHRERVYLPPEVAEERFGPVSGTARVADRRRVS
ncbi:MAG: GcrA family cell cycle regulator [Alphaproteobacteria bacterium]|nr:GcrA family cell cycle regulator [Alphaproteobacteria bacterium]